MSTDQSQIKNAIRPASLALALGFALSACATFSDNPQDVSTTTIRPSSAQPNAGEVVGTRSAQKPPSYCRRPANGTKSNAPTADP